MKNEGTDKIEFLTVIAGRKQADSLLTALSEAGAHFTSIMYGKGTVKASYLQNALGLVPEENKVIIQCVMTCAKANALLDLLASKFQFNKPNTGVAFTMPIDRLSF